MASERQQKISKEIRKAATAFIQTITNGSSLITVTRTDISPDLKRSTLYISVFPDERELPAKHFLERHLAELRSHIKKSLALKRIPFFAVEIDRGEKHRQRIFELIGTIKTEALEQNYNEDGSKLEDKA